MQANKGTWKHKQRYIREEGKEKAKVFENHFRSGGKENERQMANNVNVREMTL